MSASPKKWVKILVYIGIVALLIGVLAPLAASLVG